MCYTDFEKFQESKKKFLSNQNQEPEVIRGFLDKISAKAPKIREDVIPASICYYIASGQPDTDRVVLPVNNFDAYFGTVSFAKKILNTIPQSILVRDKQTCGLCRYKVMPEFLL